jgi:hypothetical protein
VFGELRSAGKILLVSTHEWGKSLDWLDSPRRGYANEFYYSINV